MSPSRRSLLTGTLTLGLLSACGEPRNTHAATSISPVDEKILVLLDDTASQPPGCKPLHEALSLPNAEVERFTTHDQQAARIERALGEEIRIGTLVIQAKDPVQIGDLLKKAADAKIAVIALAAIPHDMSGVTAVLGWDEFSVGEQQVNELAKQYATRKPSEPPHHIELFAGAP